MITLRDHMGFADAPLRLQPAPPLSEREKEARKRQQQADQIDVMLKALRADIIAWQAQEPRDTAEARDTGSGWH